MSIRCFQGLLWGCFHKANHASLPLEITFLYVLLLQGPIWTEPKEQRIPPRFICGCTAGHTSCFSRKKWGSRKLPLGASHLRPTKQDIRPIKETTSLLTCCYNSCTFTVTKEIFFLINSYTGSRLSRL